MISGNADRRLTDRASGQFIGSSYVTKSLTQWLSGLVCSLGLLAAPPNIAAAQEPVVEPEPVVETGDDPQPVVEPVVEPESAAAESSSSRATPVVDPPGRVARLGY